jgi:hypothetical protein
MILPMNTITNLCAILENIYGKYSYGLKIMVKNSFSHPQPDIDSWLGRLRVPDFGILPWPRLEAEEFPKGTDYYPLHKRVKKLDPGAELF